nr:MAG TPA: hypothetical protein [Caudoviricetes sp.]
MKLIVTTPFGGYQIGDEITDPAAVAAVLESDQAAYVTRVAIVDPPPKK